MKTRLTVLLLLVLGAIPAWAQPVFSSQAYLEFSNALTSASRFGMPRYTTALLPTCNTANLGAIAFDTTATTAKICNGTTWGAMGGGGGGGTALTVTANTGTRTMALADSQTLITNTGDADGSIVNLTDNPAAGEWDFIAVTVAQTLTINPAAGETMKVGTNTCTSVSSNAIGSTIAFVATSAGSGAVWMATSMLGTWTCN